MNLYTVTFIYGNGTQSCGVAARTPLQAVVAAKGFIKKKYYSDREIISVTKTTKIDRVAR